MQPWVMRPWRSTGVASTTTMPAPELASMARWPRCQSVAEPSSALYWHIGATWMRLATSTEPSVIGENRADMDFLGVKRRDGHGNIADHKAFNLFRQQPRTCPIADKYPRLRPAS